MLTLPPAVCSGIACSADINSTSEFKYCLQRWHRLYQCVQEFLAALTSTLLVRSGIACSADINSTSVSSGIACSADIDSTSVSSGIACGADIDSTSVFRNCLQRWHQLYQCVQELPAVLTWTPTGSLGPALSAGVLIVHVWVWGQSVFHSCNWHMWFWHAGKIG